LWRRERRNARADAGFFFQPLSIGGSEKQKLRRRGGHLLFVCCAWKQVFASFRPLRFFALGLFLTPIRRKGGRGDAGARVDWPCNAKYVLPNANFLLHCTNFLFRDKLS
jgi:hypothetical protein